MITVTYCPIDCIAFLQLSKSVIFQTLKPFKFDHNTLPIFDQAKLPRPTDIHNFTLDIISIFKQRNVYLNLEPNQYFIIDVKSAARILDPSLVCE